VQGFVRVPYNDVEAVEFAASNRPNIVAILVEPIQGEGGINIPAPDYLKRLRHLCDRQGWLLMLDEIQSGMGRTGQLFAYRHSSIAPDVLTLAKALGNGVPIGACLARGPAASVLGPGSHGSTFGGNPLACRAALAVLETLETESLIERSARMGAYLLDGFQHTLGGREGVADIRGLGLMLGIELERGCSGLVGQALNAGLLINVTAERVIRLLPPLILQRAEAKLLIEKLSMLVAAFLNKPAESTAAEV
jgi:acetylornithine aminotransferase